MTGTESLKLTRTGAIGMYELKAYELTRTQRLDLVYYVTECFSHDVARDFRDDMREYADSLTPVYYHEIRREWVAMNCPEPSEFDGWEDMEWMIDKTIHDRMQLAIALSNIDFCEQLFAEAETREEALAIGNAYLASHGWNTWARDGRVATHGTEHGKEKNERCTECPTHCHD